MKTNKNRDMTPFDMSIRPKRPSALLLPLMWAASFAMTQRGGLKIDKSGIKGLKLPYLVLAEHQGFTDYYIAPLAFFPRRASYVSDMEGFANYGRWLYSALGCVATRRYIPDVSLIHNIRHVLEKNKDILVIYPEARHSNVGTNSLLAPSIGKLVRLLKVPVVLMKTHGSYLDAPIWDEKHRRGAPLSVKLTLALTPEDIRTRSAEEITAFLNREFHYDEHRWQIVNKVRLKYPKRAEGLQKMLYQCPACQTECAVTVAGARLTCRSCGKAWELEETGLLRAVGGEREDIHIPDWYELQRAQVARQIAEGGYVLNTEVTIQALPNEKGFVPFGEGRLTHGPEGFRLRIPSTGQELFFPTEQLFSIHNELDYRGWGDCVVLSTRDCCYYLFPDARKISVVKIQLAAEEFHQEYLRKRNTHDE